MPREEVFYMSVAEVLDCIEDKRIDGIKQLEHHPESYSRLREIAEAIENGKRQVKELKERFPSLWVANAKQHQKNVEKLEAEAQRVFDKIGINLMFEPEI